MPRVPHLPQRTIQRNIDGAVIRITLRQSHHARPQIMMYFTLPGHPRRAVSTGAATLDAAEHFAQRYPFTAVAASEPAEIPITIETKDPRLTYLTHYYTTIIKPNKGNKPRGIATTRQRLDEFTDWARRHHINRASQVNLQVLDRFQQYCLRQGNSHRTIHKKLSELRALFNAAHDRGLLDTSPIKKWIMPEYDEAEINSLDPEQLARVLHLIDLYAPNISPIIHFIAHTGLRPSDAKDLRLRQIDFHNGIFHRAQVKTRIAKTFPLNTEALHALQQELKKRPRIQPQDHIFLNARGHLWHRNQPNKTFQEALKRAHAAGEEIPPGELNIKTLRHSFAYINANYPVTPDGPMPLPTLRDCLGHTSIEQTEKYLRPRDARRYLDGFARLLLEHQQNKKTQQNRTPKNRSPKTKATEGNRRQQ